MMSDEVDQANDQHELITDKAIALIRKKATLAPGVEGDCDLCGEWTGRLIEGACAPCRDKYKLP